MGAGGLRDREMVHVIPYAMRRKKGDYPFREKQSKIKVIRNRMWLVGKIKNIYIYIAKTKEIEF